MLCLHVTQEYSSPPWPLSSHTTYAAVLTPCGRIWHYTRNVSMKRACADFHWDIHKAKKKNHSFTKYTKLISKQEIPAVIVFIPFSLFNRMKQKKTNPFNHSFMQSFATTRSACACLSCSVLQHPRLSSTAVDNWHWRRQCVGGCVGEDDYQMSLCVKKKKPFLLEKLSFTLLDYNELSVTWAEDVQTVSVDPGNTAGKDIFKKKKKRD